MFGIHFDPNIWVKGKTPVNVHRFGQLLSIYPNTLNAEFLLDGFSKRFSLGYSRPRLPKECKNLKSVNDNEDIAVRKISDEVKAGQMSGPYAFRPLSNLRCSPIGLIPKKAVGFPLITHMSYPSSDSVNDFMDQKLTSVKYSDFNNATAMLKRLRGMVWKKGSKECISYFAMLSRGLCSPRYKNTR